MYRIVFTVFVFLALICFGIGSTIYAQTVCPDISGTWSFSSERIDSCIYKECSLVQGSEPMLATEPTIKTRIGTLTITQAPNSCLFTAIRETSYERQISYCDIDPATYATINEKSHFAGIIHDLGTKITMQIRPQQAQDDPLWDSNYPEQGYWLPSIASVGEFTKFNKKTKLPTEIVTISNGSWGDVYPNLVGWNRCASAGTTIMTKQQP